MLNSNFNTHTLKYKKRNLQQAYTKPKRNMKNDWKDKYIDNIYTPAHDPWRSW